MPRPPRAPARPPRRRAPRGCDAGAPRSRCRARSGSRRRRTCAISGRTLSGVERWTSTISAAPPGCSFAPSSFMNLSSTPTSVSAPVAAPVAAPTAMPSSGTKKIRPIRPPHSAPPAAPGGGELVGLVQLDLAVLLTGDDDGVLELDRLLGLETAQRAHDLFGGGLVGVGDGDEIAHLGSFARERPMLGGRGWLGITRDGRCRGLNVMDGRQQHRDLAVAVADRRRQAARRRHQRAVGQASRCTPAAGPPTSSTSIERRSPPVSGLQTSRTRPERRPRSASASGAGWRSRAGASSSRSDRTALQRQARQTNAISATHDRDDDDDPDARGAATRRACRRCSRPRRAAARPWPSASRYGRAARRRAPRPATTSPSPRRSPARSTPRRRWRARNTEPTRHSSASSGSTIASAFSSRTPRWALDERLATGTSSMRPSTVGGIALAIRVSPRSCSARPDAVDRGREIEIDRVVVEHEPARAPAGRAAPRRACARAGWPPPRAPGSARERVNSAIRSRDDRLHAASRSPARARRRGPGSTSRASAGEVDARVDRGLELVGDRVLDRGLGGDRRDRVDVAIGVEQRDPQPDRPAARARRARSRARAAATTRRARSRIAARSTRRSSAAFSARRRSTSALQRFVGHRHHGSLPRRRVTVGHPNE